MNKALLFQLWIFSIGFLISNLCKRTFDPVFRALISVPIGWAVFGIAATIVYSIYFNPIAQPIVLVVLLLSTVVLLGLNINRGFLTRDSIVLGGVTVLVLTGVFILFNLLRIITMSPDSSYMARFGQNIGLGDYEGSRIVFSMWGPLVPFIHSFTNVLDQKLYWQYQPILSLHLVAIVLYTIYGVIREKESVLLSFIAASVLVTLMVLSDIFVFHVFYIHVNIISALYMYLFVFALGKMQQQAGRSYEVLALISLIAFSLVRIEAPIFAIAILLVTSFWNKFSYAARLRVIVPFVVLFIAWYARVYFILPDNPDLLTKKLAVAFSSMFVGFGVFTALSGVGRVHSIIQRTHLITIAGLLLLGVTLTVLKPEDMLTSLRSIVRNALVDGDWGLTWYVVGFIAIELYRVGQRSIERHWIFIVLISYCLLVYNVAFFGGSYRIGSSDSGNRLILQAVPVVLLYLGTGVSGLYKSLRSC
jgi:hypothetical protein